MYSDVPFQSYEAASLLVKAKRELQTQTGNFESRPLQYITESSAALNIHKQGKLGVRGFSHFYYGFS